MKIPKTIIGLGLLGVLFGVCYISNYNISAKGYSSEWEHNSRYHWQKVEGSNAVKNKGEHEYGELTVIKEPTEIDYGVSSHECSICGFEELVRINKLKHEHTFSDLYMFDEDGHYHPATCSHTDIKKGYEPHTFHHEILAETTYTSLGLVKHVCDVCGFSYTEVLADNNFEFDYDKYEITEYGHYHPCVTPGYEYVKYGYQEHYFDEAEVVEPTETEDGYSRRTCLICGYIDTVVYYAHSHHHTFNDSWSHNDKNHWHSSLCEHDVKTDYYPHDFIKIQSNSVEYEQYQCETCGFVKNVTLNSEHNYSENYAFTSTTHYHPCTDEGFYGLKADEEEHDYNDFVIYDLSTCTHHGHKFHECRICGYIESIEIEFADHTYSTSYSSDETYHWFAATCEHSNERRDVTAHTFVSTLISNPTFETEGKMKYTCSVCGYYYYESIPVKEHNYSDTWSYSATTHYHACTDFGYSNLKIDEENHVYGGEIFDIPEDGVNNGERYEFCQVCCYKHVLEVHYTLANECLMKMKFTAVTGGYEVSKGSLSTSMEKIIIPDTYNKKPVISIAASGFNGFKSLKEVVFSSNLTSIGNSAFSTDAALTTMTLPNSLNSIGQSAFLGCKALTSVTIPENVTSIGYQAFASCTKLNTIIFKNSTMSFGTDVFVSSTAITSVYFGGNIMNWLNLSFGSNGKSNPLMSSTELGKVKLYFKDSTGTIVKDGVNYSLLTGFNVSTNIDVKPYAFAYYNFTDSVTFSGSTSISASAFVGSNFATLSLSKNVTAVKNSFSTCSVYRLYTPLYDGLTLTELGIKSSNLVYLDVYENSSVKVLPSAYAYSFSRLVSVNLPNNITTISNYAFDGCTSVTYISKPTALTSVGERAFYGCSKLTNADEFTGVPNLGVKAFYDGNTSSLIINGSITSIPEYCFYNNISLTSVTFPSGLLEIGRYAFALCSSIESLTLPSKLTTINERSFYKCSGFTSLTIPKSVTYIGTSAFQSCTSLNSLVFSPVNYTCGSNIFWDTKINTIDVTSGVTVLRQYIFYRATSAKTCNLPVSVKTIETQAFGSSNTRIYYAGTLAQWDAVSKNPSAEWGVQCYVTCSNGSTYTSL